MPKLANARHEAYARHLAKGRAQAEAYRMAGYSDDRGNASTLYTSNNSISERVQELKDAAARRAEVSIQYVITKLKKLAEDDSDRKTQVKALELIARHLGAFEHVKQIQHSGMVKTQSVNLEGLPQEKFETLRDIIKEAKEKHD